MLKEICDKFNTDELVQHSVDCMGTLLIYEMGRDDTRVIIMVLLKLQLPLMEKNQDQTIVSKQIWSKDLNMKTGNNSLSVENNSEKPLYVTLTRKDSAYL